MTHDEAKFILRSYRPGTPDDRDPVFAEALALADRDPVLRAWWESQRAFDDAVARKLTALAPSSGSLELILAGARAQRRSRRRMRTLAWLAAAAVAILLTLVGTQRFRFGPIKEESLTAFALADTRHNLWGHQGHAPALTALHEALNQGDLRARASRLLDISALRADGCRSVRVAGREVFEICFGPEHEFHLYLAKRTDFPKEGLGESPVMTEQGRFSIATWADEEHVYSLVTYVGSESLRRLL